MKRFVQGDWCAASMAMDCAAAVVLLSMNRQDITVSTLYCSNAEDKVLELR